MPRVWPGWVIVMASFPPWYGLSVPLSSPPVAGGCRVIRPQPAGRSAPARPPPGTGGAQLKIVPRCSSTILLCASLAFQGQVAPWSLAQSSGAPVPEYHREERFLHALYFQAMWMAPLTNATPPPSRSHLSTAAKIDRCPRRSVRCPATAPKHEKPRGEPTWPPRTHGPTRVCAAKPRQSLVSQPSLRCPSWCDVPSRVARAPLRQRVNRIRHRALRISGPSVPRVEGRRWDEGCCRRSHELGDLQHAPYDRSALLVPLV